MEGNSMTVIRSTYRDDMRESGAKGRFYNWEGDSFISVTNALQNGVPKPALTYWAAKMVAEYVAEEWVETVEMQAKLDTVEFISLLKNKPWRARDKAADMGSLVHDIAEDYSATGNLPDVATLEPKVRKRVAQYLNFLEVVAPDFFAIEGVVFNRTFAYAGAFDMIIDIDHDGIKGRYIVDIKTGKGVYAEAALQQTAYRMGEFIAVGTDEVPMPEVDGAMILHLQDTQWKLVPVVTDQSSWFAFRAALHVAKWRTGDGEGFEKDAVQQTILKGRA